MPSTLTGTYAGKSYTLTYANPHTAAGVNGFVGWANDTPVYQPTTTSTSSGATPCVGGCGSNGDVPTWLLLDSLCNLKIRLPRACGCTGLTDVCFHTSPTFAGRDTFTATGVTSSCGPFNVSGTIPATVSIGSGCGFFTTRNTPGGGGAVTVTP